jgi:hypothetical protein
VIFPPHCPFPKMYCEASVTLEERSHEIVSAIFDICHVNVGDRGAQLEAFVSRHLEAIERLAAEKAVAVYREKTSEATDRVLSQTAIPGSSVDR